MMQRFFGSEKTPLAFNPVMNNIGSRIVETSMQGTLKVEESGSPETPNFTQSLPDLTSATEVMQIQINWPKDSLESVNESICSDPIVDQFQNKPGNVHDSAENLLGVEKSHLLGASHGFTVKKHQQFEDFSKTNQGLSNSVGYLPVESLTNDIFKSEPKLSELKKNKRSRKEKTATYGSRTFKELLHIDSGSVPDKSEVSLNIKNNKKSRKRSNTLTGLEFLRHLEISKNQLPEADGIQSDQDNHAAVLGRHIPEWHSASVKGTSMGSNSEVTGTPPKSDNLSSRAVMAHIPISKLNDHIVLALDGLEENCDVQVVKINASSLLFKPEELATYLEDTWHINKALINLSCIAVLLPSSRHSSHGLTSLLPQFTSAVKKICIVKGSVAMSRVQGTWSYSRYLFLTSQDLLIMKQKTATTFKLKKRVAVNDLWLAPNPGEVGNSSLSLSIVIGWPLTTNYLLLFTKAEQKIMWTTLLERLISVEREKDLTNETVIKIVTQDTGCSVTKSLVVKSDEIVTQVIHRYLKELHLNDSDPKSFELCIKSGDSAVPLIGHEVPFYIQLQHLKEHDCQDSSVTVAFDHFVLRPRKVSQKTGFRGRSRNRRLTLVGLFGKKSASTQPDVLQSMPQPKLFGRSLSEVCSDDALPKPILDMLHCLYIHGPNTPGIFRKSGSHRDLLELKARLDAGEECNINDVSIHVVAAAVKNWLRSLPDCLLLSSLYSQWIEMICATDSEMKCIGMKRLVTQLPSHNVLLLRHLVCVLHRVSSHAERNNMTSGNLAICLGPSVLWADGSVDLTSQCVSVELVAHITQLLIDDAKQILGEDSLELFRGLIEEVPVETELNFESEDSMGSHEHLDAKGGFQKDASLESLENNSFDDIMDNYSAVQSQMNMDSGLAVSASQLEDEMYRHNVNTLFPPDQPRYAKRLLGSKKKMHAKSEVSDISEPLAQQGAEERPNSKMAGASNVRQRVTRFRASKAQTDDSFSCEESCESSDDEFLLTGINSSTSNFVQVSTSFDRTNSKNDGEDGDSSDLDDKEENHEQMMSEITKRALPAPVTIERHTSDWSSQKAVVSANDLHKREDNPAPTLDQKAVNVLDNSGTWYFMGPEESAQSNILNLFPDKQKSKSEASCKTSVSEVQNRRDERLRNRYGRFSNSLNCDQSEIEPTGPQIKQNSLGNAVVRNLVTVGSRVIQPIQTSKSADKSARTLQSLHLTGYEVQENQPSRLIRSSKACEEISSENRISLSSDNHGPSGSRSATGNSRDIAVNTSESLFRSSCGVQTDPTYDQDVLRPVRKLRLSPCILSDDEMNDSKDEIERNANTHQEESHHAMETRRRFKSDLGLSPRESWREESVENHSDEAPKPFLSPLQRSQTETHATGEKMFAFGWPVEEEQIRPLSDDSNRCISCNRSTTKEVTDFFNQVPLTQISAPVSIEQRIRNRRAVTVVAIGDAANRSMSSDNRHAHENTTISSTEKELSVSLTENQHRVDGGSKTYSDVEPLKNDITQIQSNAFSQANNSRSVHNYAPRSSRLRPMYAVNTPSAKLEFQSRTDILSSSATSKRSSAVVRSLASLHGINENRYKTGSQDFGASINLDSSSNQVHAPQRGSRLLHNSSADDTTQAVEIAPRGSLKRRGKEHFATSHSTDAAPRITSHSVENLQKDISISRGRNGAKGSGIPVTPVIASHLFEMGRVDVNKDASKNRSSPVKDEDTSVTWSVNELRKRFDMSRPNGQLPQRKSTMVKKQ